MFPLEQPISTVAFYGWSGWVGGVFEVAAHSRTISGFVACLSVITGTQCACGYDRWLWTVCVKSGFTWPTMMRP